MRGVRFRLLGPVEVWTAGQPVSAGEPRRRVVLAALLVDAGLVVPASTLVDRVWGDNPPARATRTLGTHITRIRRTLEQASSDGGTPTIINQSGGYRLVVDHDQVDLHRFRRLARDARDPTCPAQRRAELLRQAVGLWHGQPLAGLPGEWAHRIRDHLAREQLEVTAAWAQAELSIGNPAPVLACLVPMADEHPLMEPLTAHLIRALVATGRPSEALERCRTHRQRLVEEQGTDQGPELQALYEAILRGQEQPPPQPPQPPPAVALAPPPSPAAPVLVRQTEGGVGACQPSDVATPEISGDNAPPLRQRRATVVAGGVLLAALLALSGGAGPTLPGQPSGDHHPASRDPASDQSVVGEDFSDPVLDVAQWKPYEDRFSNGAVWSPGMVRISGGELQISGAGRDPTGRGNVAGGLCWCRKAAPVRASGTWTVWAKMDAGAGYGLVIGLWPASDDNVTDGMVTLARIDQPARTSLYPVLQRPHGKTLVGPAQSGDFTSWHKYAAELRAGSARVLLDDTVIVDTATLAEPVVIPSTPMSLYLQLEPGPTDSVPAPNAETPSQVVLHVDRVEYRGVAASPSRSK